MAAQPHGAAASVPTNSSMEVDKTEVLTALATTTTPIAAAHAMTGSSKPLRQARGASLDHTDGGRRWSHGKSDNTNAASSCRNCVSSHCRGSHSCSCGNLTADGIRRCGCDRGSCGVGCIAQANARAAALIQTMRGEQAKQVERANMLPASIADNAKNTDALADIFQT